MRETTNATKATKVTTTKARASGQVWAMMLALCGLGACAAGGNDPPPGDDDDSDAGGTGDPDPDAAGPGDPGDVIAEENMIDDLDDGDGLLLVRGGRVGAWYTYNDRSPDGTQTPATGVAFLPTTGGPGESVYYANTQGSGFTVWGAGMGFDLNNHNNPDGTKETYDASAFDGIMFKAMGSVPIRASVMVAGVLSTEIGGTCTPSDVPGEGCDDGHGRAILLTPEWKTYQIAFDEIRQAGWGKPVVFDAATIMAVQFNIDKNLAFDVSIDEIGFY
jgi:hypothetical protein